MKNRTSIYAAVINTVMIAFVFGVANSAYAATFTVNNAGDGTDFSAGNGVCETAAGNGICTLRAAIVEANTLATSDTINFMAGITSIAVNTEIALAPVGLLTITGPGANVLTIDGVAGTANRIFQYSIGSAVTITDLTLTGGVATHGGAIYQSGGVALTLDHVHVTGNRTTSFGGGGVRFDSGTNVVRNSTFSNNTDTSGGDGGAAIFAGAGTLTIVNSTISGNTAVRGGGIYVNGTATLRNVTVANNTATSVGGGILFNAGGGNLGNTIVANNSATNTSGAFVDSGGNFFGTPALDPLANYGGSTPTIRLPTGSSLIDSGVDSLATAAVLTTDQRGFTRFADGNADTIVRVDIGAFEVQGPSAAPVSLSGRVLCGKSGIRNARVQLTEQDGTVHTVMTGSFGYYSFSGLAAGQSVIVEVGARRYTFAEPVQTIFLSDNVTEVTFSAN